MDDYIQKSLEYTFKLDDIQRAIAKQIPDGPQRIRGLAGTGKTVVLSMKAAIAHKMHPDYKILFVFNTKSMINEIKNIISKYYEKEAQKGVNWENLEVLHAWGGAELEGLYSKTCKELGINRLAFSDVRRYKDSLGSIYNDLLKNKNNLKEKYDLVLIDEAQDFPPSFFEAIFYLTKSPKRIIWAYDEFQSLKDIQILEPEQMFGEKTDGTFNIPNTSIQGEYIGEIKKDYALKNSYRNPGYNLMVAHALALGLHRENGIIDTLPDRSAWEAIGYQVEQPSKNVFDEGDRMIISRPQETCKNILSKLLIENNHDITKLIEFKSYENHLQEIKEVANKISKLIKEESIEPSQIFVITLDTKTSKNTLSTLKDELLEQYDIKSIMPGYNYDTGLLFREEGYVTLTTPWKAKGNEANIVFVLNAQAAYTDTSYRNRNALFVSITRSRGWCYISGIGIALTKLTEEANCIIDNNFKFDFYYPNFNTLERNREKIQQSDYVKEDKINIIFDEYEDVLLDKLKNDPDLWKKIKNKVENVE
jgi:superfamily I DNA and RNA helicase